jgi:hypothetical protein
MAVVSAHCRFISEGGLFRAGASRTCQFKSPARQRSESWPLSRFFNLGSARPFPACLGSLWPSERNGVEM